MGQLPGNASNITSQLTTPTTPAGLGTPTEGALRGATAFCEQYRATHTAEDCVVVFVTDGQPSTCDVNPTDLVQVVTDAHAAGVRLYAAGMLASTAGEVDMVFIDNLANAGGTLTGYTDVALALDDASKAAPSCD